MNQQLLNSYESISDGFLSLDVEWKIIEASGLAAAFTCGTSTDLTGAILWEAYSFLVGTPFELHCRQALLEQIQIDFEQFNSVRDQWFEVRVFPRADGLTVYFRDITKRHASDAQLKLLEAGMALLHDIVVITEFDAQGMEHAPIRYVNEAFKRRTGFQNDDVLGKSPRSLLPPLLDANRHQSAYAPFPSVLSSGLHERLHSTKNALPFWVEQQTIQITDANGFPTHFISVARDISDRKKKEVESAHAKLALKLLKRSNEALLRSESEQELLELICAIAVNVAHYAVAWVGMAEDDAEKNIHVVAHASLRQTDTYFSDIKLSWSDQRPEGRGPAGQTIRSGVPLICEDFEQDANFAPWSVLARNNGFRSGVFLPLKNKEHTFGLLGLYRSENWPILEEEISLLQALANDLSFGIANLRDRAERQKTREDVHRLAFYDTLTQLPNRQYVIETLTTILAPGDKGICEGAILHVGLDNFKDLNDTAGHEVGDFLLQQASERIVANVSSSATVARIGGDEFLVILTAAGPFDEKIRRAAERCAEAVILALSRPYNLAGSSYVSTASIGSAQFNTDHDTVIELLKRADLALSMAKAAGRNTLRFFDPVMQERISLRASLIADLRPALERDQIFIHYQPQVDDAGLVTGVESLLRWHHPLRGNVTPATFIPLSEEIGTITLLGQWVLRKSCEQLAAWADNPITNRLTIAVNVSAHQFRHEDFVSQVQAAVRQTGADPKLLKLELTESLLAENIDAIIAKMLRLKALGIGFSLDDFGTGYSSLSYLRRMPLDQLKIDQSFVRDALNDPNDAAIARTIVALGKSLGLQVIAEGVETELQRQFLQDQGCLAYQGYLFSKPLSIDALTVFLSDADKRRKK